jgi:hypothetical protein
MHYEKNADSVNTIGIRKGCRFVFCTTQWMQKHTKTHLEGENRMGFSVGIRWLGGMGLHTTRSIAQIFVEFVFNVSSCLYNSYCGFNCI